MQLKKRLPKTQPIVDDSDRGLHANTTSTLFTNNEKLVNKEEKKQIDLDAELYLKQAIHEQYNEQVTLDTVIDDIKVSSEIDVFDIENNAMMSAILDHHEDSDIDERIQSIKESKVKSKEHFGGTGGVHEYRNSVLSGCYEVPFNEDEACKKGVEKDKVDMPYISTKDDAVIKLNFGIKDELNSNPDKEKEGFLDIMKMSFNNPEELSHNKFNDTKKPVDKPKPVESPFDFDKTIEGFERDGGELVGVGGDGKVYKYKTDDKTYAIKVYNEIRIDGMDVIEKISKKNHDYIVKSTFKVIDDVGYEIMPYYDHGNLGDHLKMFRQKPQLQEDLYNQLVSAIEFLHNENIQHRDLKTGNVLVESINPLQIRVTDFGRSRSDSNSMSITQSVGTFKFMAPEALAGMPTKESDLFSLGIIMAMVGSNGEPFRNGGHLVDNTLEWSKIHLSNRLITIVKSLTNNDRSKRSTSPKVGWLKSLFLWLTG